MTSEIAAIEELRRATGVSGQRTQRVYVDSRRTLYSRMGDVFPWVLVIFTGAGFLALFGHTARRALRPRSSKVAYAFAKRSAKYSSTGECQNGSGGGPTLEKSSAQSAISPRFEAQMTKGE